MKHKFMLALTAFIILNIISLIVGVLIIIWGWCVALIIYQGVLDAHTVWKIIFWVWLYGSFLVSLTAAVLVYFEKRSEL